MKRLAAVIECTVFLLQAPASAQEISSQAGFRATPSALERLEGDVDSGYKRIQSSQQAKTSPKKTCACKNSVSRWA